ncbi:4'-phosphopantetheinyl transferase superfamily protein [Flavobacterium jejuense]|uniref:4'-phosphopantetheinyl transferase superfamily protein n=1 Tax=Flavobacterium jejuense TaxID=1544455 RepID=A0ABX0IRZ8_9FLAO|nr:4'-phosphopantetheinyl transferase superfamily protein [Flavobacterium jejuense]NHN26624.1 4'-phosphopantetheinyl transferase superfamily protein [Flavobacterium jejuense]
MPFYKEIIINDTTSIYLWKIEEDFNTFFRQVQLKDTSLTRLECMKSESHQNGFLAVRMLLQYLQYSDFDLYYDDFGKPHLKDGKHISISHSQDFSAILISNTPMGIDLEILKDKIVTIAPRFMDASHLENLEQDNKIKKATVIWGIKESIFKIKNERGISFPKHIFEKPFHLNDKRGFAQLRFNNLIEEYCFQFEFVDNYALVCAFQNK